MLPAVNYEQWRETCDTLHAHTQVLGKLAAKLAPPEPQLQHAALRLTARGWETLPLPAPDRSGSLVVLLDLRTHEAVVEHSGGRTARVPLTPHRPVGAVTRDVLAAVRDLGGPVEIDPTPQEVPWQVPLDADEEHARYDPGQVGDYFAAATLAAQVLAAYRAPYRGRSTPVNAWWGSFDLAVSLFSGLPADPRRTTSSCATRGRPADRGRLVAGRRAVRPGGVLRVRAPGPARLRRRDPAPRPRAGTARWGVRPGLGRRPAPPRTRTRPRWSSPVRPSGTPVPSAGGTRRWRPARRDPAAGQSLVPKISALVAACLTPGAASWSRPRRSAPRAP